MKRVNSWRTTIAGLMAACGVSVALTPGLPAWITIAGKVVAAVGTGAIGFFARDNGKSDEDAGAKPKPPEPKPPIL